MIMYRIARQIAGIALLALLLAACAAQPPVPEDNYYRLPEATLPPAGGTLGHTLALKRFVTDGLHSERALLYCEADMPLQLRQYHYHHWLDSPPRLIQEHMISALRSAHVADTVLNYDPVERNGLQLSGKIRSFEHRRAGDKATVIIDMELRLDGDAGKLLFVHDYRVEQVAASAQPRELVMAYGEALQKLYGLFLADWRKLQR